MERKERTQRGRKETATAKTEKEKVKVEERKAEPVPAKEGLMAELPEEPVEERARVEEVARSADPRATRRMNARRTRIARTVVLLERTVHNPRAHHPRHPLFPHLGASSRRLPRRK